MIVVGGFNTSIDKYMTTDAIRVGGVARVRQVRSFPGGKGLHVALTVAALGEPVQLVGIIDERHGNWFKTFLEDHGVAFLGTPVSDDVRTCLAVQDAEGRITELLEPGPELRTETADQLNETFLDAAAHCEVAALSGSLPAGGSVATYARLVTRLSSSKIRCAVDASGETLRHAADARPFLLKPNREEAESLVGWPIQSVDDATRAVSVIAERGTPWVVLSLGADGIVARADKRVYHAVPPSVPTRNTVGSGDCLLGGLLVALARQADTAECLRLGVACGTANALGEETGIVRRADVDALLPRVDVRVIG